MFEVLVFLVAPWGVYFLVWAWVSGWSPWESYGDEGGRDG